jgi:hypothetical protein
MLQAQTLRNPILFVTVTPTPQDSITQTAAFGSHQAGAENAPRGGDLMIRYPDGTVKNLTKIAGYGMDGMQAANAIAVREPSIHWSGAKALFSMVIGAPLNAADNSQFYWQIYEISGLGKDETPMIIKIPGQPVNRNNIAPVYGSDDKIIFISDKSREGQEHLYPLLDEYKNEPSNSGLWSLDPQTGTIQHLDHSPSGDFSPFVDSYGRLLFIRWDHLQRDRQADIDSLQNGNFGSFNYENESATAKPQFKVRTEYFPAPQGIRTDILGGTNMTGLEFNIFIPWAMDEDGSNAETMNHLGLHDLRATFNRAITDDPNVVVFNFAQTSRLNRNPIVNIMQIKEDPQRRGIYYAVDASQVGTHGGGQIISFNAPPTADPNETQINYITHRSTSMFTFEGQAPNPSHSGFYRNPVPCSDGNLIASHTATPFADKNLGTFTQPQSRYDYRLKFINLAGGNGLPGNLLTQGINKSVSWWQNGQLINFSGMMWEVDAVEVVARQRPARRTYQISAPEQAVFQEENVDPALFKKWLEKNNQAVIITRDITQRDKFDRQQPYYLRVKGTQKQSANATGKIFDIAHLQIMQGDQIRGYGMNTPQSVPKPGRRVIAVPMHDVKNITAPGAPAGAVDIAADGSLAAFVPARKALSWQLVSPSAEPVVRERFWVTFKAGDIRVCASCHGNNSEANNPQNPIPQNKPEALRSLLRGWRASNVPQKTVQISPVNMVQMQQLPDSMTWQESAGAVKYRIGVQINQGGFRYTDIDAPASAISPAALGISLADSQKIEWTVQAIGQWGNADISDIWSYTVKPSKAKPVITLLGPIHDSSGISRTSIVNLRWQQNNQIQQYQLQIMVGEKVLLDTLMKTFVYSLRGLQAGTIYSWRVRGLYNNDSTNWSEWWTFSTKPVEALAIVKLIAPADKSTEVKIPVNFTWTQNPKAVQYILEIDSVADFTSANRFALTDYYKLNMSNFTAGKTYYWRVQSKNADTISLWSDIWQFTIQKQEPSGILEQAENSKFQIYPNPSISGNTMLRISGKGIYTVQVDDITGRRAAGLEACTEGIYTLPELAPGFYIVRVLNGGALYTSQFIVMP